MKSAPKHWQIGHVKAMYRICEHSLISLATLLPEWYVSFPRPCQLPCHCLGWRKRRESRQFGRKNLKTAQFRAACSKLFQDVKAEETDKTDLSKLTFWQHVLTVQFVLLETNQLQKEAQNMAPGAAWFDSAAPKMALVIPPSLRSQDQIAAFSSSAPAKPPAHLENCLVVFQPLWKKDGLRQLRWWHSQMIPYYSQYDGNNK